jgi:cobalt-zinc-cadmium efflux system outer membrane protein
MWGRLALALALALPASASAQTEGTLPIEAVAPRFPGGYRLDPLEPMDLPAAARDLGAGAALRLDEVIASVDAHHPPLEALAARARSAEGARLAAEGAFDPVLGARGFLTVFGYYEYGRLDVSVTQATPLWGTSFFAGWRIGRSVEIDRGFPEYYGQDETLDGGELRAGATVPLLRDGWIDARRATLWRAERATDAAEAELAARRLRVVYGATEAYLRWIAAGRKLEIALALARLAEDRDAQLAARSASGAIAPIEHLENRRAVLERRQAVVTAARALERAAIALGLFYRDEAGAPRTVGAARYPGLDERFAGDVPSEEEAVALALAQRPELERFRALRESAEIARDLAENQVLPRLDLTLSGSGDIGSTSDSSLRSRLSPPVAEGLVTLSIPLLLREGFGRRDAARADLEAVSADAELARDQITLEVRDAFSALRAAEQGVALATESREIAAAVAEAERARFEAGATTLLIVNLREATAAQAAASWVDARIDVEIAHALVRAVTGGS